MKSWLVLLKLANSSFLPDNSDSDYMNVALLQWMLRAKITKHITFHSARHTFAVLQLTLGTELYTLQKLLGHSEIRTTQIYAEIIDEKKREAVNKIPDINL